MNYRKTIQFAVSVLSMASVLLTSGCGSICFVRNRLSVVSQTAL